MTLPEVIAPFMPVIIGVVVIVGGVCGLRIFFSLWSPIDRRINGDQLSLGKNSHINELKDKTVDIHLRSKAVLAGVVLQGYCSTHHEAPYHFKQLLIVRLLPARTHTSGRRKLSILTKLEFDVKPTRVRLFIKPYCTWCSKAQDWLDARGIPLPFQPSLR